MNSALKSIGITVLLLMCLVFASHQKFSSFYRKCEIYKNSVSKDAIELSLLQYERVPRFNADFYIEPIMKTRK
jgi:hypothetical protein